MKYEEELENLIMDMLPMYQAGCKLTGNTVDTHIIIKKLMQIRKNRLKLPALLDKGFSELGKS